MGRNTCIILKNASRYVNISQTRRQIKIFDYSDNNYCYSHIDLGTACYTRDPRLGGYHVKISSIIFIWIRSLNRTILHRLYVLKKIFFNTSAQKGDISVCVQREESYSFPRQSFFASPLHVDRLDLHERRSQSKSFQYQVIVISDSIVIILQSNYYELNLK